MAGRLTRRRPSVPVARLPVSAPPPAARPPPPLAELRRQLSLAWPVVLGTLGSMGMGVVDTVMVGAFGGQALAAVSLAVMWGWGVGVVARNAPKGMDPVVAQAVGAGDRDRAGRALVQGLALAGLLGLPVIALHLLAAPGLALLGQPPELLPLADDYCRLLAWGVLPMLAFTVVRQFLQALGRVREATVAILLGNGINVVLNQVFMHGIGTWPGLGPIGCAWSSLVGQLCMLGALLWLARDLLRAWWPAEGWRQVGDLQALRRMAGLGLPVGLQVAVETWGFQAAGVIVGWTGPQALAAHAVAMNLATVAFMTPLGISAAAATRVGQLLGAGRPWGRAAATSLVLGALAMTASAGAFLALPGTLARLYTQDAAVVALTVGLLPIAAAFQLFDGVQVVAHGVLRGLADVRLPMVLNLVAYWGLGLPLGALLGVRLGLGPQGVWMGLAAALALVSSLLVVRIRRLHRRGVVALG